ncbi:MAG: MFS transporter [Actinomycetota bacterium]
MSDESTSTLGDLLRRRSVRSLLLSRVCASSGSVTLAIAMGVFVFDRTGRELDIAWVGIAEFLPTFLLVLYAGSLADRLDRRFMAAIAYAVQALIAFGMAWYVVTGLDAVWPLFLLTAMYGTARGFANPPSRALPANVVAEVDLPRLIPALATMWQMAAVFAPLISSALYGINPAWTFVAIAVLDVVAAIAIAQVKLHAPQQRSGERPTFTAALDGLRLVRRTPLLLAAIGLDLFAVLLGGVVALAPPITEQLLGAPSQASFWMRSAGGLGAALTALYLARRPIERGVGRSLLIAVATFGVLTIGIAFSRSLALTLCLFAALAAADMVSVFVRATIVPLATPDTLRGRVLAVEAVFIGASNELGAFESGLTAELFGLVPAIVISGVATLVVVAVFAVAVPDLRRLDRFSEIGRSAPG